MLLIFLTNLGICLLIGGAIMAIVIPIAYIGLKITERFGMGWVFLYAIVVASIITAIVKTYEDLHG